MYAYFYLRGGIDRMDLVVLESLGLEERCLSLTGLSSVNARISQA